MTRSPHPRRRSAPIALAALALLAAGAEPARSAPAGSPPHHALQIRFDPGTGRLAVTDTVTLPPGGRTVEFLLNARLSVTSAAPRVTAVPLGDVAPFFGINAAPDDAEKAELKRYRATLPAGERRLEVRYEGKFDFPLSDEKEQYTRGFRETPGAVRSEGIYLAGHGFWYPRFDDALVSFEARVALPEGWHVIGPGRGSSRDATGTAVWDSDGPVDEIVLVGGPLVLQEDNDGPVPAQVYLRQKDETLAGSYLGATALYTKMYGDLLGPYPYAKFALVENFWETGYGMPSFTLLGPQVIRFPFILHSSYPHEILHNWWGNSVFVDYASGNWCEGLTAYMADHLIAEQRGRGAEHRRAALQRYRDFAAGGRDFPLAEFRSRHSAATEAVGYGRTMMGFHMLRLRLGDDRFRDWARGFYETFRGKQASFADIQASVERIAGAPMGRFFDDWVKRTGAPGLEVASSSVERTGEGYTVRGLLRQSQAEAPFLLEVPLVVQSEGAIVRETVPMTGREASFAIATKQLPQALHVDPEFDLFRRLDERETPSSIGQIFGEPAILAVIPSAAPPAEQAAWRALVEGWRSESHQPEVKTDAEVSALPADRAVWILGGSNRLAPRLELPLQEARLDDATLTARGETIPRAGHSIVLTVRHPRNPAKAAGWILADPEVIAAGALPGLMRKLPHYGKYSYLGFAGTEPANVMKGEWSASDSPMRLDLRPAEGRAAALPPLALPARKALADPPPVYSESKLRETVEWLAAPEREGRGAGSDGLARAGEWIAARFQAIGLKPAGDGGTFLQRFTIPKGPDGAPQEAANVAGMIAGSRAEWAGQAVVVGAHYDHLGRGWPDVHAGDEGKIHPGADDNASGVAVMLELARVLAAGEPPQRTVLFVAFAGEEAGRLGSIHFVDHAPLPIEKSFGMVNLDTVGRLRGGRVTVLAAGTADEWQHIFRGAGYVTGVDSRIVMDSLESSDQKSFIDRGIPAVQLFTEPHADYHRPGDTADKVDVAGLVKVAGFSMEAVTYLAGRAEPLTTTLSKGGAPGGAPAASGAAPPAGGRRVSFGTVPDFEFAGPGVRITGVTPGSPAETAGLKAGDVITAIAGQPVASLKGYSDLLKTLTPGTPVAVTIQRDGVETTIQVTPVPR